MAHSSHSPSGEPNRLANETSPYLLQHAYNPVDWYPWGDEAFAKASAEDKPVFLSIGYSACHWCHVMERESFENEEIAQFLNEHYVSIKVDREERPDLDQIYMSAVQLITRRGGWPMSVFLTPDGEPFYGGTYWPPVSRHGMPGFKDLLIKLFDYWAHKREEVLKSADELVTAIDQMARSTYAPSEEQLSAETLRTASHQLVSATDRRHGGFGGAPKFPHPMDIRVLLRAAQRFDDTEPLEMAKLTLDKMAAGGIYDHLGGGFHRYSTDAHWLVPHFEKMLYDNALLVPAYLEMYQCTGDERYASVVRETLDYVLREMTAPEGGFYSTQDADTEGEEGKFFVWSEEEIVARLGADDAALFNAAYGVTPRGNWEGKNILNRVGDHDALAQSAGMTPQEFAGKLEDCRERLRTARSERVAPARDDKILVAWNGLMISAMAQAAATLDEPRYLEAARHAAEFHLENLRDDSGRLLHSFKDSRARFAAYLDDYACLINGLLDLYAADFNPAAVEQAASLADEMLAHFADEEEGGFYYTANDHERLITRTKDSQDQATPSGNGMAATCLLRLGDLTGTTRYLEAAEKTLTWMAGLLQEHPRACGQALLALDLLLGPTFEVAIVDGPNSDEAEAWIRQLRQHWLPRVQLARRPAELTDLPQVLESLFADRPPSSKSTQAFVCERGRCLEPAMTWDALARQLELH